MDEQASGAFRVETVAIIGAGTAGRAFALRCAQAGLGVVLEDVMPSKLRRAQDEYSELSGLAADAIRYANTVEDAVKAADLAIDFVPDELESKLEIFSLLDRMAPPRTLLCTPTKALSITDLASCTYRADRCIAVRSTDLASVEIIESKFLSPLSRATGLDFFTRLGYECSLIADSRDPMLAKNATSI